MMNIKDLWSPYAGDLTAPEGQAVGIPVVLSECP